MTDEASLRPRGSAGRGLPTAASQINERRARSDAPYPKPAQWHVTGEIATQDEDGFLQITDRLSRFSKIGGETVSHIKVEEKLHELVCATEPTFVVTSARDEKQGERLVVLHKLAEEKLQPCLEKLAQSDLPNLWKPRPDAFVRLESFPMPGSRQLDLRKVKELAGQLAPANRQEAG